METNIGLWAVVVVYAVLFMNWDTKDTPFDGVSVAAIVLIRIRHRLADYVFDRFETAFSLGLRLCFLVPHHRARSSEQMMAPRLVLGNKQCLLHETSEVESSVLRSARTSDIYDEVLDRL